MSIVRITFCNNWNIGIDFDDNKNDNNDEINNIRKYILILKKEREKEWIDTYFIP